MAHAVGYLLTLFRSYFEAFRTCSKIEMRRSRGFFLQMFA